MNFLLLGSGGREHAFAWKITQSPLCSHLFIAPGNAGTAQYGTNVSLSLGDFESIQRFCTENNVGMIVVGPEEPLVKGIADFFESVGIAVIGPSQQGAQLEGSKAFAKQFMQRHNIPTANYREFNASNYQDGVAYLQQHSLPIVIKADGLAAGKGVVICQYAGEAIAEFELMIQQSKFGDASKKVVIEEFLDGIELSVFVLTDGKDYVLLPEAKDYKRVGEGDKGPNTGGMGAVSPVAFADEQFMRKVEEKIIRPTINGLHSENINYKGFIFFGLIKVNNEPFVIEYNCRMGDPETEVVLPRLKNDLAELFKATSEQKLGGMQIDHDPRTTCTIMAVSGGYPGQYEKDKIIEGLANVNDDHCIVFHAGTKAVEGQVLTNGGRVLCVTAYGNDVQEALRRSRTALDKIHFDEMYYRKDIGYEFI
ncbi:MAG TPA: phosphoribosylamine--glycine ligase [Chitinophagaceae bacterium]|nr:phosphoribosylamine--glycine ligase [Chitinophagaceae bacterium]